MSELSSNELLLRPPEPIQAGQGRGSRSARRPDSRSDFGTSRGAGPLAHARATRHSDGTCLRPRPRHYRVGGSEGPAICNRLAGARADLQGRQGRDLPLRASGDRGPGRNPAGELSPATRSMRTSMGARSRLVTSTAGISATLWSAAGWQWPICAIPPPTWTQRSRRGAHSAACGPEALKYLRNGGISGESRG
jgi:hypothetical protein